MEDGRRNLWYHASLIPYSITGNVHAFMGPLPRRIKKPHMLTNFLPNLPSYEPLVFVDAPFNCNFFKNKVLCSSPHTKDTYYIKWLDKVQEKKNHFFRDLAIFDLIQLSRVGTTYNSHMLVATICFWDASTNSFHLPCRMITSTLFNIVAIVGLLPTREAFEPLTKTKTDFTFVRTACNSFIEDHQGLTDRVDDQEHIAFLTYRLSTYVL